MFDIGNIVRGATAMVGALVLSTLTILAAVGPAEAVGATTYAAVQSDVAYG